jgi:hypothetical protein
MWQYVFPILKTTENQDPTVQQKMKGTEWLTLVVNQGLTRLTKINHWLIKINQQLNQG